jgi:hypothetical protein
LFGPPNYNEGESTGFSHSVPDADHGPAHIVHGIQDSDMSIDLRVCAWENILGAEKNPDARRIPGLCIDSYRGEISAGDDDGVPAKVC